MTAAERVASGAQLLDKQVPGWHRIVESETLNIGHPSHCICGQLARYFGKQDGWYGMTLALGAPVNATPVNGSRLTEWIKWVNHHGFGDGGFSALNEEWKASIDARVKMDAMTPESKTIETAEEVVPV